MKRRRAIVLKAFLSRCSPEKMAALDRFLPDEERVVLSKLPAFGEAEERPLSHLLGEVHWSWYLPTLKSYPEQEQILFLESLNSIAAQNLQNELHLPPNKESLSESARHFLRQVLLHSLIGPKGDLIPREYLPPSFLNVLVRLGKKELIRLIDYLSLYDLAHEMRQIVETKMLKKIYSLLKDDEKRFLKRTTAQKEPYPVPRIGLEKWDGTESVFRHLLHRRGLARLGTALSGQDPDLIWYICHQLDIGRGTALYKFCAKEPILGTSEWVIRQIEDLFANPDVQL